MLVTLMVIALSVLGQPPQPRDDYGLPEGATVIEVKLLAAAGHANRALILWMMQPEKHPRESTDEFYTCPEETRGSYFSGPTRVSLFNSQAKRIINTVNIGQEYDSGEDSFDVPNALPSPL